MRKSNLGMFRTHRNGMLAFNGKSMLLHHDVVEEFYAF
jgi:hypothetical protein